MSGGTLIIDGVAIDNVDFTMDSGSHVIVKNGGVINMSTGNTFYAPLGQL